MLLTTVCSSNGVLPWMYDSLALLLCSHCYLLQACGLHRLKQPSSAGYVATLVRLLVLTLQVTEICVDYLGLIDS